jgi:putative ABC transport system substrate-binding protein
MKRREFIAGLGAAAALPFVARAQQPMPVIGYLGSETPELFASRVSDFRAGLHSTGYVEGHNVRIDYRWAEGHNDRLPMLAADLVRQQVTVIATPGSIAASLAAKAATSTIPIVFETGADPITAGLIASLNRPGGNITGVVSLNAQVGPKRLELLHELLPDATVFTLLVNPTNPRNVEPTVKALQAAAGALGLKLHVLHAGTEEDFDRAFVTLRDLRASGLVIANDTFYGVRSKQLGALASRNGVPAVHQSREFAAGGGLMSYGGSVKQSHGAAGIYTGRILKGEKPTDLPVQQVTTVELVINLKAARALGITVPIPLLGRADETIE